MFVVRNYFFASNFALKTMHVLNTVYVSIGQVCDLALEPEIFMHLQYFQVK